MINSIDEKPDVVIGMGDQLGKFLAEKFSVPYYQLVLQYYQTPNYASNTSFVENILETLEKWYRQLFSKNELNYFNNIRKDLGLKEIHDFNEYIFENENVIIANSMILSNFNYIKHEKVFISGNINLYKPLDNNIEQVEGLSEFLSKDTNYIYLNLGSMSQNLDNELISLYLKYLYCNLSKDFSKFQPPLYTLSSTQSPLKSKIYLTLNICFKNEAT